MPILLQSSNDLYLKPRFPTGAQWYSVHCTDCKCVLLITLTCTPLYNDYRKPWKKDATGISALVEGYILKGTPALTLVHSQYGLPCSLCAVQVSQSISNFLYFERFFYCMEDNRAPLPVAVIEPRLMGFLSFAALQG